MESEEAIYRIGIAVMVLNRKSDLWEKK
jgi:hypothetical protein